VHERFSFSQVLKTCERFCARIHKGKLLPEAMVLARLMARHVRQFGQNGAPLHAIRL